MALEPPIHDRRARIAAVAAAMLEQFGADAGRIAQRQASEALDGVAQTWSEIVEQIVTTAGDGLPNRG